MTNSDHGSQERGAENPHVEKNCQQRQRHIQAELIRWQPHEAPLLGKRSRIGIPVTFFHKQSLRRDHVKGDVNENQQRGDATEQRQVFGFDVGERDECNFQNIKDVNDS